MVDLTERERVVLAEAYANPDLTPGEIADRLDETEATVEGILSEHGEEGIVDAAEATDWDDPNACPFCGATLPDGGPGFMTHVEDSRACKLGFERWRENVAGDIGGEWSG